MPEGYNRTIVCNVPWVAAQFWGTAKRFFPKRDVDRVKVSARSPTFQPAPPCLQPDCPYCAYLYPDPTASRYLTPPLLATWPHPTRKRATTA